MHSWDQIMKRRIEYGLAETVQFAVRETFIPDDSDELPSVKAEHYVDGYIKNEDYRYSKR